MKTYQNALLAFAISSLASCGGGSSSPPNTPPTINSESSFTILEGARQVANVSVRDANGDAVTLSLSGDDAGLFTLENSALLFVDVPDFESPFGGRESSVYSVTLVASDGKDQATQDLSITVSDAFEGRVVDGPISGATAFVDLNGNGLKDADEPVATTDANGFFFVPPFEAIDGITPKIIASGGVDTFTGNSLTGLTLKADIPSDLSKPVSVTPLTSLLASVDTPEQKQKILSSLGVTLTPDEVLTTDTWAAAESGDEAAKAVQKIESQIANIVILTAPLVDDQNDETNDALVVIQQVATKLVSSEQSNSLTLTQADFVSSVVVDSAAANNLVLDETITSSVVNAVSVVNSVVADEAFNPLSDTASGLAKEVQGTFVSSLNSLLSGDTTVEEFVESTSTEALSDTIFGDTTQPDNDVDGIPDSLDVDDDNDGVKDILDAFPIDGSETLDSDGDGTGNNADTDDDNDGVADAQDAFPLNPSESVDTDKDGIGNNADTDDDGDGVADSEDTFPLDKNESVDTDGDGTGNNADTDDDGDGVADASDAFPLDKTESLDTDADGIGNNADTDDDGDGVADASDAFPLDATESVDTDQDGIGNNADTDDDGDGTPDIADAFPLNAAESLDTDGDGTGNNADTDDDGDGVADASDAFPLDKTESIDTDGDGTGNNADTDDDGDGVADASDAFPLDKTESLDTDADGIGNNADTDDDGDGVADSDDTFPLDKNEFVDTDGDGTGNNADTDDDGDGVADSDDTFPLDKNESVDTDGDGTGNNADTDDDGDGVADASDAFPLDKTESLDTDADGIGNNADTDDDGDGVADASDAFPLDATESVDTDQDGIGNNADTDDDGDGTPDIADAFPLNAAESLDTDGDGTGNNADTDDDGDGVADASDAFPLDKTESIDTDGDGTGNNADTDDDGDGVADASDAFPLDKTESLDTDADGIGNNADTDDDGDGVADASDAFPLDATESVDTDSDGIGNNADTDDDGDGVADTSDAFPLDSTESVDTDGDGTGNNADTDDDGDGVADASDAFPLDATESVDTDSDGIGNNADPDDDNDGVADASDDYPLNANVHTAPTATTESFGLRLLPKTTNSGTATLSSTSQDSRAVTYSIVSNGSYGTATITNTSTGAFSYETTSVEGVSDTFTFKVNDGYVDSAVGTITINLLSDPLYTYQWHLDNTGQTNFATNPGTAGEDLNVDTVIANGITGEGVEVAVVDSGLEIGHEDLVANVVPNGSWNYLNSTTDPTNPSLTGDHGTSAAGIIAATAWNNKGGRGIAPDAKLRGFNFLQASTNLNEANALGSSNPFATTVDIFNMSYGSVDPSLRNPSSVVVDALGFGVTTLRGGRGALYVNSVGNGYFDGTKSNADISYCGDGINSGSLKISCNDVIFDPIFQYSYLIGVGALGADGKKSPYSTTGAALWISAPGGDYGNNSDYFSANMPNSSTATRNMPAITTTDQSNCTSGYNGSSGLVNNRFQDYQNPTNTNLDCNYTNTFNGTSSAAPMVSGVIALMLEANPNLGWRDVKHILATTARKVDASFTANSVSGVEYVGWTTNAAGYDFHPWYGFGAVDAQAAVDAAKVHTNLTSHQYVWHNSVVNIVPIPEQTDFTQQISVVGSGTIEQIRVAISLAHAVPNSLGFRLESPSGTISTLLPPATGLDTYPNDDFVYLPTNAFYGEDRQGTWTLHIVDHFSGSQGLYGEWAIQFMYR